MDKTIFIKTIMTPQPLTVEFSRDVLSAQAIFRKHRFRHLPVVRHGELVGMLSKTDVDRLSFSYTMSDDDDSFDNAVESLKVSQLMFPHPRTVRENDAIFIAASILAKEESHALPVLSDDGERLVGIVTTADVIRYMLNAEEKANSAVPKAMERALERQS